MNEGILLNAFQYYKVLGYHVIRYLKNSNVNLQVQDVVILETLHCYGSLSQQELANLLGLNKSTVQRTVRILLQKGILSIGSDPNDKRKNILHMTTHGIIVISDIIQNLRKIMPQTLEFNLHGSVFPL